MLEDLIALDKEWRLSLTKLNDMRHERKQITTEIAKLKKAGKEADDEVHRAQDVDVKIGIIEKQVAKQEQKTHSYLMQLPNLLDETVPI